MPSSLCQATCASPTPSAKVWKALLPKRDPPVSSGGHFWRMPSARSRTCRMAIMAGLRSEASMAETGVSRTQSERVNTKERRSE